MFSVWPKFYPTTDHYRELDAIGGIYRRNVEAGARDWVGPGYLNAFYDPYSARARRLYWRQIRENIAELGFDAWWLDSDEPDFHSNLSIEERAHRMGPTALGPGAALFNSYPLAHVDGIYRNLVEFRPDTRPFILTRSGFGGIQRAAAALWSGDVVARWDDLRDQISAGVNLSMSGIPNWTHDIGGFALEDRYTRQDPDHLDEWRELNLRWFQFGAFSPLFRSHGEAPRREIFEIAPEGSDMYRSMAWYDRLRYRLMPYIYTLAADAHHEDGTIMRGLVMDFPADRRAWNVADQYLFGPAFLVAPVTEFRARQRDVYLPAGALWYDFHTGRTSEGGQTVRADAPYERMPLFVRAGSIVPVGPAIQHTNEGQGAPVTLFVYTGADGSFSLYEDDGVSRQYLNGSYARIPLAWDEATGTLTLGPREGRYEGMAERRTVHVRWMRPGGARALDLDADPDATIDYGGSQQSVVLAR
jgi:alpha-D-xyloside xylohydrolase